MQKSFIKSFLIAATAALAVILSPNAVAQVVTSGIAGIVKGDDGKPSANATVTAVHTPTNATFKTTTNSGGRYAFRNLPVGGPYTVSVTSEGLNPSSQENLTTELGTDIPVDFTLKSEVLKLEKFTVSGEVSALDSSATGPTTLVTRQEIEIKPTTQRSFADLVSATPTITLRSLSGDREEAQITALGQNNRYNSIMIDGNRINDQFGLNATGLASFFNPIALDTVEQFSVLTNTPDVRYSGFTGATVNFVTKSGSNEFHGTAYYIFSGDHLGGLQLQGPDARTLVNTGAKVVPHLEKPTYGFIFRGPLWKDHLWFFVNYEKLKRIGAPNPAGLPTVDASDLATIVARVAAITKVKYGSLGGNANSVANEEKKLVKIDWEVMPGHRLSARYSTTEGQVPQFGSFTTTSTGTGLDVSPNTIVGGAVTAFDSHFYAQQRKEKSYSAELLSHWTPDLTSDVKWSHVKQDQYTPTASIAPEIDIYGVKGVNQAGAAVTNGVVVLGTERFRHGNQINVDTKNYAANIDYARGNLVYTVGFDMEDNSYYNLFRQFSYGVFNYSSPAAFLADTPNGFQRNFTDLSLKGSYADISQYTQTGAFAQAKWTVSNRLNAQAGLRYDWSSSDTVPAFNQQFLTDTGMRNDGTVDGAKDVSPRFGFNLALDDARTTQLHGALGYYVGRAPWVFWSNSYGNSGVGTYSVLGVPAGGLDTYLATFDPANPYGTAPQVGAVRAEVDLADAGMHMPSLWRGTLTLDHKISFLNSKVTIDVTHSINDNQIYITNDNLKSRGNAADGRNYFFGNPSTAANALYPAYTNIYHLRNKSGGRATYATVSWDREMKNNYSFGLAYTRGKSSEAQAAGQTTASGMWQRNAVFNQGAVEIGTSDFEIKDRIQARFAYQFKFWRDYKTTASLYYEGRSGTPYSFAYSNDLNGDGMAGNDLVSVPTGLSDTRFDFSKMTSAQQTTYVGFFANELAKYSGGHAPKNILYQPWVNRLDLHLEQDIPLHYRSSKLNLFLDFTNFGNFISKSLFNYVERAPSTVNDVFDRKLISATRIDTSTGLLQPQLFTATFRNNTTGATTTAAVYDNNPVTAPAGTTLVSTTNALLAPSDFLIDNVMSRWRIQVGIKLSF